MYRGNESALLAALDKRCEILESKPSPTGINRIKLHIASDSEVRGVIATTNESVELRSFSEIIPSMNDIFIRAVNGNL